MNSNERLVCIKNTDTKEVFRLPKTTADVMVRQLGFIHCNKTVYKTYIKSLLNK